MNAIDTLRLQIRREKARLLSEGAPSEPSERLHDLVRAIDALFVRNNFSPRAATRSVDERLSDRVTSHGANVALALVQTIESQSQEHRITSSESLERTRWADLTLRTVGILARLEYLLSLVDTGLGKLQTIGKREIRLIVDARRGGIESVEREDVYRSEAGDISHDIESSRIEAAEASIRQLLRGLNPEMAGRPCIGFDNRVSQHFYRLGRLLASRMPGYTNFAEDASFGGVTFSAYRTTAIALMGLAHEHFRASDSLIGEHTNMKGKRWVLTPVTSIGELAEYIAEIAQLDVSTVRVALQALTLSPENVEIHCKISDSTLAPLVAIGGNRVLLSMAGAMSAPLEFLLYELRRRHPDDWNVARQEREKLWRAELYDFLPPEHRQHFLTTSHGPKIYRNKRLLTDIDAVIFDCRTGVLGLFQFKWQDLFARDMYKRSSRMKNFLSETQDWLDRTTSWVSGTPPAEMFAQLGLKQKLASRLQRTEIFVIGRYFAHFSGQRSADSRAVWGTWGQVRRLVPTVEDPESSSYAENPLQWLAERLRDDSPLLKDVVGNADARPEVFEFGEIRLVVHARTE